MEKTPKKKPGKILKGKNNNRRLLLLDIKTIKTDN